MKSLRNILSLVMVSVLMFMGIASLAAIKGTTVYAEDCSTKTGPEKEACEAANAATGGGGGGSSAVDSACSGVSALGVDCGSATTAQEVIEGPVGTLIDLVSYAVGIACVVMIIYGGFRFITSGGNADATKSARNTILYALLGLFIILIANILINFVFGQAKQINDGASGSSSTPSGN